ncbi:hypothetical protein DBR18_17310 [Pseudomonas sp. HMWF021]|nr:hypothetical protein DBR18_17310 [Pseudomonas sp. HMWF021]
MLLHKKGRHLQEPALLQSQGPRPLWERACSRTRCISQHLWRILFRLREQARSHRGGWPFTY